MYQNESLKPAFELFNFQNYNPGSYSQIAPSPKLLTHDKVKLVAFGNRISMYASVVTFYNEHLQESYEHAVTLINTLRKEYDIEK